MKLLSVNEVAEAKNVTRSAVYRALRIGAITPVRTAMGEPTYLVTAKEAKRYLAMRQGRPRKQIK